MEVSVHKVTAKGSQRDKLHSVSSINIVLGEGLEVIQLRNRLTLLKMP